MLASRALLSQSVRILLESTNWLLLLLEWAMMSRLVVAIKAWLSNAPEISMFWMESAVWKLFWEVFTFSCSFKS